jgi:hypothetical protein
MRCNERRRAVVVCRGQVMIGGVVSPSTTMLDAQVDEFPKLS